MKKFLSILSIFLVIIGISGCGSSQSKDACSAKEPEVILVTDQGGINDKSFNQGTWEGLQEACSTLGIGANYIQSKSDQELEGNLREAAQKAPIVVASGFTFEKAVGKVAQEFPDTNFIIIDGQPTNENGDPLTLPNVFAYFFNETEAGYLVGYIAGKETKSNKLGFVGGLEIPPVQQFGWGFLQGIQAANPKATVTYEYTSSFTDTTKGKNTANAMIADGVDIIFTAAGGVNNGVVEAAIDSTTSGSQVQVIGVDRDMYEDGVFGNGESVILTSAVKNTGKAALSAVETLKKGEKPQSVNHLTVADGFVGLPENNPNLADNQALIDEAKNSLQQVLSANNLQTTKDGVKSILTIKVNGKY